MDAEKMIINRMAIWACSRLEAIASLEFGLRSEAAKRCLKKREKRKELIESVIDFQITSLIIERENNDLELH
jgi:hypothetical protein